ncbi:O-antigen polymerase [Malikia spinosa]|uniref:O-antigen polymerase n=1 Tax=Malikia spinosa TaxID=86180 RepID=UPI0011B007E9|nr:O-antigen polymerase [Malikia spinosa]
MLKKFLLALIISIFSIKHLFDGRNYNDYPIVAFSFAIIIIQSLFLLILPKRNVSLFGIYYVFAFIFFGYAPSLEYINEKIHGTTLGFDSSDYLSLNLIIIMINFSFYVTERFLLKNKRSVLQLEQVYISRKNTIYLISLLILSIIGVLYTNSFSLVGVFFRGGLEGESLTERYSPISLVVSNLSRISSLFIFILFYTSNKNWKYKFFSFIGLIFCCFPTGMSRFFVAAIYVPVIIVIFPNLRYGQKIAYTLLASLFTIFPILDKFRRASSFDSFNTNLSSDFFIAGHFDSYQNFMRVIQKNIVTNGDQLFGNLLFFIPRELWNDKPISSGAFIARKLNYGFDNISMAYFAEGYINFGYFGVIIYTLAILYAIKRIEENLITAGIANTYFYMFMIGFFLMFLRGDFLVAVTSLTSIAAALFLIYPIISSHTISKRNALPKNS